MSGLGKLKAAGDRLLNAAVLITVHSDVLKHDHAVPMAALASCCLAVLMLKRNARRQTGRSDSQSSKVCYNPTKIRGMMLSASDAV